MFRDFKTCFCICWSLYFSPTIEPSLSVFSMLFINHDAFQLWLCVAVNYVAIADALEVSSSVLASGLAADNVICAIYFTTLFALASKIPPESSTETNGETILTSCCMIVFYSIELADEFLFQFSYISLVKISVLLHFISEHLSRFKT